jgi:hypothetical protein
VTGFVTSQGSANFNQVAKEYQSQDVPVRFVSDFYELEDANQKIRLVSGSVELFLKESDNPPPPATAIYHARILNRPESVDGTRIKLNLGFIIANESNEDFLVMSSDFTNSRFRIASVELQ